MSKSSESVSVSPPASVQADTAGVGVTASSPVRRVLLLASDLRLVPGLSSLVSRRRVS